MQSLKNLSDQIGWSYSVIRSRVSRLEERFEEVSGTGKHNRKLITDKGIALIKRLKEIEDQGHKIEAALDQLESEMEESEAGAEKTMDPRKKIEELKREKSELEAKIRKLEREKSWLMERVEKRDDQIERLLPGESPSLLDRLSNLFTKSE